MKNKTKKFFAWVLILIPAFYIAYHTIANGAFTTPVNLKHLYVFIAVVIWLVGDYLLSTIK